jgi:hypothetical protein
MKSIARCFVEGCKLAALFGAVALVVWSMPEGDPLRIGAAAVASLADTR